jgi:saccharopine dehydrogenase (NAD+, L-lysine-forming)
VSGFNPLVDNVVLPLGYGVLKLAPRLSSGAYASLLVWALRTFARPPFGTVWQVEAEGVAAGRRSRVGLRLLHADGYWLTAATAAACLLQHLDGSLRTPGVHLQALAVKPARLLRDLLRMGASFQSFGVDARGILGYATD